MKRRRVLITGGSGLLALNWAYAIRNQWDVVLGTHLHSANLAGTTVCVLNLESTAVLERQLMSCSPDLVVNTVGLTDVDFCEKNPSLAFQVNASTAENVAKVAANLGINMVHISTDHLYGGEGHLYNEESPTQPLNEYARTKLVAEKLVLSAHPQALIVRTNFFGWGHARRQSFSDWIIDCLRTNKGVSLFDDVFFTPILADAAAIAAHELVAKGRRGVINLVGDERVSKYDFGLRLAQYLGLPTALIRRDQVANASLSARRPKDMSLDNTKARLMLGRELGTLEEYFSILLQQEQKGRRAELLSAVV
jgi:dTDP-4-dehydrorhamnose reductase